MVMKIVLVYNCNEIEHLNEKIKKTVREKQAYLLKLKNQAD